jgi:glycerate 2-kinase
MEVAAWTERLLAGNSCLREGELGRTVAEVLAAALAAVDPYARVLHDTHRLIKPRGEAAVIGEFVFDLAADPYKPSESEHGRIWIFGAGKASAEMAAALVERFGERVAGGVVIAKHGLSSARLAQSPNPPGSLHASARLAQSPNPPGSLHASARLGPVELLLGDHPIPGAKSAAAAARLRARAAEVGPRDLVLCPISGGASALLSEPLLDPEDWATLTEHLLARDVSIQAINKLRRRFDALKAGGLARLLCPATVVGLLVSDVVGDELALIGSGPTVYPAPGEADSHAALLAEIGDRLHGLPDRIARQLAAPPPLAAWPSTPSGRPQSVYQVLLARNGDAREAACKAARAHGLDSIVLLPALGGLASTEGRRLAQLLADPPLDLPVTPPWCLVMGGETTVALGSEGLGILRGIGGRNLELALAAVEGLAGCPDVALVTLATDGEDGPTDAAGALITGSSLARIRALGLDPSSMLAAHDSYQVFDRIGDLVRTGSTGTNVCDLALLFRLRLRE